MKPQTYRIQKACANCKYVFILEEYDNGDEYFCHIDKTKRPKCGSCYMQEHFLSGKEDGRPLAETDALYSNRWNKWILWSEPREVAANGICDQYEEK